MTINAISNNLQSQYTRRSNLTEKANAIYAKLNEGEQNFLDKDTVEKALQDISVIESSNGEQFSLDSSTSESIDSQKQTSTSQYNLATELAIRMQGSHKQIEKQQQTLSLSLDDTGVLVRKANKRDSDGEVKKTNASTETSKSYEQEFISKDSNHQYISITA